MVRCVWPGAVCRTPYYDTVHSLGLRTDQRTVCWILIECTAREKARDQIKKEVEHWARSKSFISMLNEANAWQAGEPRFLTRSCSASAIAKAYKLAMLKIHPDKNLDKDYSAQIRCTEMFKEITSRYNSFRASTTATQPQP